MFRILLSFTWFGVIPIFIGMLITHFMKKEKNNLLYSILIGYFTEFSVYQIFTIPCTYLGKSFDFLYHICLSVFIILCLISLLINYKELKKVMYKIKDGIKETPKLLFLLAIILIGIQCYYGYSYMHIDEDDSNFVAKATISLQTNTLYKYSDTGAKNETYPVRYVFSPFPVYTAAIAKFTGYHPMAIAHTAFPVVLLILIYINYYLLGNKLFNDDKKKALIFLIFVNLIYIFGDDLNLRCNFRFALVRLWQGKAVLGNLIIPSLIVIYDSFAQSECRFSNWWALIITMCASCIVSTMGLALAPIMLFALTIIYLIRTIHVGKPIKKSEMKISCLKFVKLGFLSLLCCAPNLLYAIMYAIKKGEV